MKTAWGVLTFLLPCAIALAADSENPYKAAKVGEWTAYKSTMTINEMPPQESETKTTVIKKTDDECVVEIVQKSGGKESAPKSMTFKLKEKQKPVESEVKELGKGEETISAGGTAYKTQWAEEKVTSSRGAQSVVKTWRCDSVPLGGLVKRTTTQEACTVELVLTGCGRGK